MSSRMQQTGPPRGGKWNQKQRSYVPARQRRTSNYRFSFRGCPTKVNPVRGWRFAPACCAAQSVFRRGPGYALPLHRLACAALNLLRLSELHQPSASAGSMKTAYASLSFGRQAAKVVRPNRSLNRTLCGGPGLGFKSLAQTRPAAKCRLASTLGLTTSCFEPSPRQIIPDRLAAHCASLEFRTETESQHHQRSSPSG